MTPLEIPHIDRRYFWPNFISLTLDFDEVMQFQIHSSGAADCYTAVSLSEIYSGSEIRTIFLVADTSFYTSY